MAFRLARYDFTLYKAQSGSSTARVPAAGVVVKVYRRGAWANQTVTFGDGVGGTVNVIDPGDIVTGDVVQIATGGVTRTVSAVTATSITFSAGSGSFAVTDGIRLVVTANDNGSPPPYGRPLTFTDEKGTEETATRHQSAPTDSNGETFFYSYNFIVDAIADDAGTLTLVADVVGGDPVQVNGPEQWGGRGNNADDTASAFTDLLVRIKNVEAGGTINIPAGTWRLGSTVTINTIAGLTLKGAGREQTILSINHSGIGLDITGSCTDVTIEGMTIQRLTGTADQIQIGSGNTRTTIRDVLFKNGGTGIDNQGVDTRIENVWFTGTGWTTFIQERGTRARITNPIARPGANWSIGIDVDSGCSNCRIISPDVSGGGSFTGIGIQVRNSLATTAPFDIGIVAPYISSGFSNAGILIDAVNSLDVTGGMLQVSSNAVRISAGTGMKFIGLTAYASNENSFDINGGSHIRITECISSNCNVGAFADNRADHVNVAAGVDDISINGLTVGKLFSAGTSARYGVRIEAGVSDRVQILGLRGNFSDLTTGWISNLSTSTDVDISHNIEAGASQSYSHSTVSGMAPATYGAAGPGIKTITDGSTSTSVTNIHTMVLNQSGSVTWTGFVGQNDWQVLRIISIHATNNPTFTDGATFRLASTYTLTQDDTLSLIYDPNNARWCELARSVN